MIVEETKTHLCKQLDVFGLSWQVSSRTKGHEDYTVDFRNPGGMGCQCKWFQCEVSPSLKRGQKPRKYCFHWYAAMNAAQPYWMELMIELDKRRGKLEKK